MDHQPEPPCSVPLKIFTKNISKITLLLKAPLSDAATVSAKLDAAKKDPALATEMTVMQPLIDEMIASLNTRMTILTWAIPMLVTFAEAYLQDALTLIVSGAFAKSTLPGPIVEEISSKWIKNALRGGTPHQWINQLKKFGAIGYPDDLAPRLQKLWDARHEIIHSAEPDLKNIRGFPLGESIALIGEFVRNTDAFVMAQSIQPRK